MHSFPQSLFMLFLSIPGTMLGIWNIIMSKNVYITTVCGAPRWAGSARPPHTEVSVITQGSKFLEGEEQTCRPRRSCLAVEVVPACKSARRVQEVRTWRTDRSKVCGAGQGPEAENALVNSSNGRRAGGWRERWAREGREAQTVSSIRLRATRLKKPPPLSPQVNNPWMVLSRKTTSSDFVWKINRMYWRGEGHLDRGIVAETKRTACRRGSIGDLSVCERRDWKCKVGRERWGGTSSLGF